MQAMPESYLGREQTWLKHRVLQEYVTSWAFKRLSSDGAEVHLWYVDCFAGPWESKDLQRQDTSIAIGLKSLNAAADSWKGQERAVRLHAAFIEKDSDAFRKLKDFVQEAKGVVDVHLFEGTFGQHLGSIDALVGRDSAFFFVDPTGWDGADLAYIARLANRAGRDVLVNVMFDHINRFKDDERAFLRRQMRDFFGLSEGDLPSGLSEEELMALYRERLKALAGVPWVLDLAVPVPTRNRTNFRLVVAGHHVKVVELFRMVEAKVMGIEASPVRVNARARPKPNEMALSLFDSLPAPKRDPHYSGQREAAMVGARESVLRELGGGGKLSFLELWPDILCAFHLTLTDLKRVVCAMEKERLIRVEGREPRQSTIHDPHLLSLVPPEASPPAAG